MDISYTCQIDYHDCYSHLVDLKFSHFVIREKKCRVYHALNQFFQVKELA
jgi:hypothetical protein